MLNERNPPCLGAASNCLWRRPFACVANGTMSTRRRTRVSVIGQVVSGSGFSSLNTLTGYGTAHCRWRLAVEPSWTHVHGALSGSSQSDSPTQDGTFVWQQPIDACFDGAADVDHTWPRIEVEVRWRDSHDRSDLAGYGVVHVPAAPGIHNMVCPIWRPRGTLFDRVVAFFIGGRPHLKQQSLIFGIEEEMEVSGDGKVHNGTSLARESGKQRLTSEPTGVVRLSIGVCLQQRLVEEP